MSKTFRPYQPDQLLMLPPSMQEWLPTDHAVYFVSDLVDSLELRAILETYTEERVRELKEMDGQSIWLCGGSLLAGDLYAAGLVDELILKVNPVVFGEGKPLFGREVAANRLELRNIKRFESGHLVANYTVTT